MERKPLSKPVLKRLPGYLAYLKTLPTDGNPNISATALAAALDMGEVQVRKDLALVSDGGRPKLGYDRKALIDDITRFLGYDSTTNAILIGAGKLGQALMGYSGFHTYGLDILAAFDAAPSVSECSGKPVLPMDALPGFCAEHKVHMAVITVPAQYAQGVCELLVENGIRAIWNFAPVHLDLPGEILVQNENMATSLAVLSVRMQEQLRED